MSLIASTPDPPLDLSRLPQVAQNVGTTTLPAIAQGTYIISQNPGGVPGGAGSYQLGGPSQTVGNENMFALAAYLPAGGTAPLSGGMVPNNQDFIGGAYTRNSVVQGASSGFTIAPNTTNIGSAAATTVSLQTSAALNYSKTALVQALPFMSGTATSPPIEPGLNVLYALKPGQMVGSPTSSGIPLNSPILSLNPTHLNIANGITDTVPLMTTVYVGSAPTATAVPGIYTIYFQTTMSTACMTNTGSTPWCIVAPAGGNSQSGIPAAGASTLYGTVTFEDLRRSRTIGSSPLPFEMAR